ncbi:hypothetical protein P9314_08970 [Paenibacillus validus]|uniref:hypothetical protein n=1 Tax=Paenibacillus TaxID=44249 RepID=UPI000FD70937|nr:MULTISPECIES: hypothetical protein [Paenibacillus]MED4600835.1 hypothetical protein [Paenibacillus validus]MED4606607.1 hypothetical protein [Paenibacillus validus]
MERNKYYVSVQSRSIMSNQGDAAYELEIEATDEEIKQLQELFEVEEDFEIDTFWRAHAAGIPYHYDQANVGYDMALQEIYRKIHALGTKETKDQIEKMQILNQSLTGKRD